MAATPVTPLLGAAETSNCRPGAINASRLIRIVDTRLIPLLFVTYMLNFMDKTILSSASVFGLIEDTNLHGQQYSWVSSIFYFGYFLWEGPTNFLIPRLPVAKYMAVNAFFWGAVVALTAACVNYSGLLVVRFFLGVAEATITPAFMFITSSWYTRDEIPVRTGIWFSGNAIGGLLASILAYAIGHIESPLHPWRWMFIILGGSTFCWAFALLVFLPDNVSTATFLSPEEREFMMHRVVIAGTGYTEKVPWEWSQTVECLMDPKTWHLFAIAILTQIPNGGTQNFANLVIKSFGFSSLQSTLINIPYSLISTATIALTGWIAGRSQRMSCILIIGVVIFPVIGSAIIFARAHGIPRGVQLFGYFLLASGSGAMPLAMSLVQANYKGVSKKMTMTALMFLAYCAGNLAGPHLFRANEAPTYQTSFGAILICYSLVVALAVSLRMYLQCLNAHRDRNEGIQGDPSLSGNVGGKVVVGQNDGNNVPELVRSVALEQIDYEDVTDLKTTGFRYRL